MVDLADVQGYSRKLANQRDKLEAAAIAEADREAIRRFIAFESTERDVNEGTLVSHLNRLRLATERADVELVEMERDDVTVLFDHLGSDYDLSDGTIRNYRKALRLFFDWLGRDWADSIRVGSAPDRKVDPSTLLAMDDIEALLDAARNPRDQALVALLADTGLRISAVASLRVRDFQRDGQVASVRPNQDAPVKGATDPVPVTWAAGYVANWLSVHPEPEPEAPLFRKLEHDDAADDGAMTYQYLARRLRWLADDAGLDRERVRTHNFRKSAISRWIREGLSEQAIKHRAHWVKDSSQFATYSGVTAEEMNEDIRAHYGLAAGEEDRPAFERCPSCGSAVTPTARFCPGCAAALTAAAAEDKASATGELADEMVNSERARKRAALRELMVMVDEDPSLLDEVELPDHGESP